MIPNTSLYTSAVTPEPSSQIASPATSWFVRRLTLKKAIKMAIMIGVLIAINNPINIFPVKRVPIKPVKAPIIIIPSMPRFSTPERSTMHSPSAAKMTGVLKRIPDATMPAAKTKSSNF